MLTFVAIGAVAQAPEFKGKSFLAWPGMPDGRLRADCPIIGNSNHATRRRCERLVGEGEGGLLVATAHPPATIKLVLVLFGGRFVIVIVGWRGANLSPLHPLVLAHQPGKGHFVPFTPAYRRSESGDSGVVPVRRRCCHTYPQFRITVRMARTLLVNGSTDRGRGMRDTGLPRSVSTKRFLAVWNAGDGARYLQTI